MDENASQSILMVGGILIAISVLSFFVYAIATFGGFANNMNAQIEGSEIQKYNQHFFQYSGRCNITFQDVVSAINFAKDWNDKNDYTFNQVASSQVNNLGTYATNVYIVNSKRQTIRVFGDTNWLKSDVYGDNQKVKDVLNQKLADPEYADYYYAVNIQTITVEPHLDQNYYVLHGNYGAIGRDNDIDINSSTGFIQNIYFTAVTRSNYSMLPEKFTIINKQGKNQNVTYTVQKKDYFKMTEIED